MPPGTLAPSPRATTSHSRSGGVVCHLIASNFFGGPEKQIVEQALRLPESGWNPVIGSFRENRDSVDVVEAAREHGIPTFLIDTRSSFNPAMVGQLASKLTQFNVDILVTHGYKPNLVGHLASRGSSTPQIPFVRGYTGEDWKIRCYEVLDRRLLKRFERVLCVSEATRRLMIGHGLRPDKLLTFYNCVDTDIAHHPVDLRREFKLPSKSKVIVAAGRLSPEKGHRFLVEAMAQLNKHTPDAYLVILGSGRLERALQRQISNLGLTGKVILAGFRKGILGFLSDADLVVNPSMTEGFPNVLLEALSVSTPVVATDVGGVAELISSDQTGWLVSAGDVSALAAAMTEALTNPTLAATLAAAGRERVAERHSFRTQTKAFATLYSDVVTSV